MAGATIWKGYIHFGDTDVAVKLHTAVREERAQFRLLHRRDGVRLRQQMICAYEKQPVPAEEQSKGFEVEDGKYLIIDPADLEQTVPESNRMIEVHEFVKTGQIDPILYDRVYYLEPEVSDIQGKGFAALVKALTELDVAGICTWAMRKRSYFGALQASGKILRLNTLRYADEVIPVESLGLRDAPLAEKELKIGSELIEKLAAPSGPRRSRGHSGMCAGGADPPGSALSDGAGELCQNFGHERTPCVCPLEPQRGDLWGYQDLFQGRGRDRAETLSGPGDRENGEEGTEGEGFYQLVAKRCFEDDDLRLFPARPGKAHRFLSA
jgi:DNA end-binding protein Ku